MQHVITITLIIEQVFIFTVIRCPLNIVNGHLTSTCWGIIGEKCELICDGSREVNQIICQSSGFWDKNATLVCSQTNKCGNYLFTLRILKKSLMYWISNERLENCNLRIFYMFYRIILFKMLFKHQVAIKSNVWIN